MSFNNKILNILGKNNFKNYKDIPESIIKKFNKTRPVYTRKYLCNAPFRNLYFNTDGQVSVCCYNLKFMVGNINYNTISEIWNGSKIKELRKHIADNDLSLGCDSCKHELLLNNFENLHIKYYDEKYAVDNFPTSFMFQTDNICNLECTMCTGDFSSKIMKNRENRVNIENPYKKEFYDELYTYLPGIKECVFSGGEPFLINSYFEIWNKIIEVNPSCLIVVQTNGTILNEKIKSILEKGNFHIGISLDSLNEKLYNEIRVNADLKTTLENIEYFKTYNHAHGYNTGLSVCVMNQNIFEIPSITGYCSNNDMNILYNTVKFPAKNAVWILNSTELKNIIDNYSVIKLPSETSVQKKNKTKFNELLRKIMLWYDIAVKWENHTPVPFNEESILLLQTEIINKLESAISVFNNIDADKIKILSVIKEIFNEMPANDIKHNTLKAINSFSGSKISANIFRENDESLRLLIKNMVKFPEIQ